ncbi:ras-like protein family member 12 isoform 3-T4 [Hipposideros larvatus]
MGYLAGGKRLTGALDKAGNILPLSLARSSLSSVLVLPCRVWRCSGQCRRPGPRGQARWSARPAEHHPPRRERGETRGGLPQSLQGVWRRSGRPRPPGSTGPSSHRPTGAAGTQPAQHRVRGADTDWAGSRVPGEPVTRSRGPRRAGTLLGALRPRPLVPLFNVAMSSVFGKPRAGSGPQSAPLEVNLAILGRRGAGKSALTVKFLTRRFISEYDPNLGFRSRELKTVKTPGIQIRSVF